MLERFADAIAAKAVSVLHGVVQAVSVLQLLAVVRHAISALQVWSINQLAKKLDFYICPMIFIDFLRFS